MTPINQSINLVEINNFPSFLLFNNHTVIAVRANIKTLPPINLLPGKVVQVIGFYWGKGFEVLHH
jgi:hypothetical protein